MIRPSEKSIEDTPLRDRFALEVMQALIDSGLRLGELPTAEQLADMSYTYADAMIARRKQAEVKHDR